MFVACLKTTGNSRLDDIMRCSKVLNLALRVLLLHQISPRAQNSGAFFFFAHKTQILPLDSATTFLCTKMKSWSCPCVSAVSPAADPLQFCLTYCAQCFGAGSKNNLDNNSAKGFRCEAEKKTCCAHNVQLGLLKCSYGLCSYFSWLSR